MAFTLRSGGRGTRRPFTSSGGRKDVTSFTAAPSVDPAAVPGALAFDLRYSPTDEPSAQAPAEHMTALRGGAPGRTRRTSGRSRRPGRRIWSRRYAAHLALTDLFALSWAAIGVHMVHLSAVAERASGEPLYLPFVAMTLGLLALWLIGLTVSGSRDVRVIGHGPLEYKRVANATLAVFGAVAIASYLFKLDLPRSYVLIMMPAGLVALLTSRFIWRRWLHGRRDAGEDMAKVLAVGNAATVRDLIRDLRRAPRAGYEIVGVCVRPQPGITEVDGVQTGFIDGVPILGDLDQVAEVVRSSGVDTVAITSTAAFGAAAVRRLSWELEDSDADLILAPALTNIAGPRIHTQPVAGLPLIHVDRPTYRGANRFLKKAFDVVGSSLLMLLASPVLLGVALAVKISSPGPAFFLQERVGINGTRFRMIKLRSMVVDAEARLAALQAQERDAGNDVLFKIKDDPRITGVGRFIRRYSLDELPQLINVLKGDMSLVGPRPPLSAEVERYETEARRRLLVKPGITGLWQVSGRSDLTWDESVRLDVYYVENWSITADLVILWKTAKATVSSAGAY